MARPPSRRLLLAPWLIAAVVAASALASEATRETDRGSQGHAEGGLFRLLPYESTAQAIDGRRDRYWSGDFLRFVDGRAKVEDWSMILSAGERPAELLIARAGPRQALRFLVTSDIPEIVLQWEDWARSGSIVVDGLGAGSARWVEITPSPAWRRHGYWWSPEQGYRVASLRLAVDSVQGRDGQSVTLRYLGGVDRHEGIWDRSVTVHEPPSLPAVAGGQSSMRLELRNDSERSWQRLAVTPVTLAYRIETTDGEVVFESPHQELADDVPPGGLLEADISIQWPREPGHYRLSVDLVREHIAWYREHVGDPLFEIELQLSGEEEATGPLPGD